MHLPPAVWGWPHETSSHCCPIVNARPELTLKASARLAAPAALSCSVDVLQNSESCMLGRALATAGTLAGDRPSVAGWCAPAAPRAASRHCAACHAAAAAAAVRRSAAARPPRPAGAPVPCQPDGQIGRDPTAAAGGQSPLAENRRWQTIHLRPRRRWSRRRSRRIRGRRQQPARAPRPRGPRTCARSAACPAPRSAPAATQRVVIG